MDCPCLSMLGRRIVSWEKTLHLQIPCMLVVNGGDKFCWIKKSAGCATAGSQYQRCAEGFRFCKEFWWFPDLQTCAARKWSLVLGYWTWQWRGRGHWEGQEVTNNEISHCRFWLTPIFLNMWAGSQPRFSSIQLLGIK